MDELIRFWWSKVTGRLWPHTTHLQRSLSNLARTDVVVEGQHVTWLNVVMSVMYQEHLKETSLNLNSTTTRFVFWGQRLSKFSLTSNLAQMFKCSNVPKVKGQRSLYRYKTSLASWTWNLNSAFREFLQILTRCLLASKLIWFSFSRQRSKVTVTSYHCELNMSGRLKLFFVKLTQPQGSDSVFIILSDSLSLVSLSYYFSSFPLRL